MIEPLFINLSLALLFFVLGIFTGMMILSDITEWVTRDN